MTTPERGLFERIAITGSKRQSVGCGCGWRGRRTIIENVGCPRCGDRIFTMKMYRERTQSIFVPPAITQGLLHELLDYDANTGSLIWKKRDRKYFTSNLSHSTWNSTWPGEKAGWVMHTKSQSFRMIGIFDHSYKCSRIIWQYVYGIIPEIVDHINGNSLDDRLENLRNVDSSGNARNIKLVKRNTTGIMGVSYMPRCNKYKALVYLSTGYVYLGQFDDFFEACCARKSAERKYNFHPNHGARR